MAGHSEPEDLRGRLEAGDEAALGEAFDLYRDRMERIVRFRIGPALRARLDPEDVVQETYLAAGLRQKSFDASRASTVWVWLRMILAQTMTDLHRAHVGAKRDVGRESRFGGLPTGSVPDLSRHLIATITGPMTAAARDEMLARTHEALDSMDEVDREILVLRHFEESSNREAAEILDLPTSTVSDRYLRALQRLRTAIGDAG